jgi:hypothetical protein
MAISICVVMLYRATECSVARASAVVIRPDPKYQFFPGLVIPQLLKVEATHTEHQHPDIQNVNKKLLLSLSALHLCHLAIFSLVPKSLLLLDSACLSVIQICCHITRCLSNTVLLNTATFHLPTTCLLKISATRQLSIGIDIF